MKWEDTCTHFGNQGISLENPGVRKSVRVSLNLPSNINPRKGKDDGTVGILSLLRRVLHFL